MKPPTVTYLPDLYRFMWIEEQIQLDLERIREERGDTIAEVIVTSSDPMQPGLLHHAKLNLTSSTTRASMARSLTERLALDWSAALEQVCHLALKRWRDGDPLMDLRDVDLCERPRFLLPPFIEYAGPTVLFADGGTGKTTFMKAIAVSLATCAPILGEAPAQRMNVAILDWETDAETHAASLRAICAGLDPPIEPPAMYYQRMTASLAESAPALRRKFGEMGIGYAIVDSLGAARGGEPESADTTIRLFNAGRLLGVPWGGVDHVTKNGTDKTRPFGSTYTHNLARVTWSMEKAQDEGEGRLTVALTNHKANNGRLARRRGYHIDFDEDGSGRPEMIRFTSCDIRDVPKFTSKLSQRDQLAAVLRANNRAMTVEDLAAALEADGVEMRDTTIRAVLNRHKDHFAPVPEGRIVRWGLLTRAYDNA